MLKREGISFASPAGFDLIFISAWHAQWGGFDFVCFFNSWWVTNWLKEAHHLDEMSEGIGLQYQIACRWQVLRIWVQTPPKWIHIPPVGCDSIISCSHSPPWGHVFWFQENRDLFCKMGTVRPWPFPSSVWPYVNHEMVQLWITETETVAKIR